MRSLLHCVSEVPGPSAIAVTQTPDGLAIDVLAGLPWSPDVARVLSGLLGLPEHEDHLEDAQEAGPERPAVWTVIRSPYDQKVPDLY